MVLLAYNFGNLLTDGLFLDAQLDIIRKISWKFQLNIFSRLGGFVVKSFLDKGRTDRR